MGLFSRGPALAPLTPAPKIADLPRPVLRHAGRYLGTLADDERVRARGLGAAGAARIQLSEQGVDVIRLAGSFRIPAHELRSGREVTAFGAGPVAAPGALVIRWEHDERVLDSGFRLEPGTDTGPQSTAQTHRAWSRAIAKVGRSQA